MTALRRFELDELDSAGVLVDFEPPVVDALQGFGLVAFEPMLHGLVMRPTGKVGAVRVADVQVEVRPKGSVGIASVFFLLGYARDPGLKLASIVVEEDADVLEAIAEALVRQAEFALNGGPLSGYVAVEETARTVRGRIRLSDQVVMHHGRPYPVETTYDDFSCDIPENRILLTALRVVEAVPRFRQELRGRVAALLAALDGVEPIHRGQPLPRWTATRLNQRYHSALNLAELLLSHHSIRLGADGRYDAAGFVVDMPRVFEDFVGVALREALAGYPGTIELQSRTTMDDEQPGVAPVTLIPDVVWRTGGTVRAVADAKYKAASGTGDYPNADKYQMLAYCTALGVERAWLVYAQGGEPVVRRVRNSRVEIVEWPLDLSVGPEEVLAQVGVLAEAMRSTSGEAAHRAISIGGSTRA